MDKKHLRLNSAIFYLALSICFILSTLLFFSACSNYYQMRFDHFGVYLEFNKYGIESEVVDKNIINLTSYLSPFSNALNTDFYSKEDILHLYDVKNILNSMYFLLTLSVIYVVWNVKYRKNKLCFPCLTKMGWLYISTLLFFGLMIFVKFDYFFTLAHELTFTNEYWLLDPTKSNLIKFFPQEIFVEIFVLIIITNLLLHFSFIMLVRKFYGKRYKK